jgi:hypothetical protein
LNHEDALTTVTVGVRVLQDVEQVATFDMKNDVLEPVMSLKSAECNLKDLELGRQYRLAS